MTFTENNLTRFERKFGFQWVFLSSTESNGSKNVGSKKRKTTFVEEEKKLRELLNEDVAVKENQGQSE